LYINGVPTQSQIQIAAGDFLDRLVNSCWRYYWVVGREFKYRSWDDIKPNRTPTEFSKNIRHKQQINQLVT